MTTNVIEYQNHSTILEWLFQKAKQGMASFDSANVLAEEYRNKFMSIDEAIENLIANETWKAASTGFISGIGGIASAIVMLPANLTGVLFIQTRLVMTIAILKGYDPDDPKVRWLIIGCLCGDLLSKSFKQVSAQYIIKVLNPLATQRLITQVIKYVSVKFVAKSSASMFRFIPLLGGLIGGGMDYFMTESVDDLAHKVFFTPND